MDVSPDFDDQDWPCHSERSEESGWSDAGILRFAQNDILNHLPILAVKIHQAAYLYDQLH
jgi:hypothetical protein